MKMFLKLFLLFLMKIQLICGDCYFSIEKNRTNSPDIQPKATFTFNNKLKCLNKCYEDEECLFVLINYNICKIFNQTLVGKLNYSTQSNGYKKIIIE